MKVLLRLIVSYVLAASAGMAAERSANWSGEFSPCDRHSELLKEGHLELGVRFSTTNRRSAAEFARALDFWATVLDMEWREDNSRSCAIQIVDGRPDLFTKGEVARAQLPDRSAFQGWIALNPNVRLPANEMFFVAVHELGHLLGLPHNSSAWSVMFYLQVDEPLVLNEADLGELAAHHKLRVTRLNQPLSVTAPGFSAAEGRASKADSIKGIAVSAITAVRNRVAFMTGLRQLPRQAARFPWHRNAGRTSVKRRRGTPLGLVA